ncbi:hypothetical protein [Streptomyces sp. NBC_00582]|uniref:hypothetical protein n=1 Tax=Streptomyces sp. NBC_00582 TaxID=2975783 RepID=UPI002E822CA6|nr:hypothetical protein [Streptomyces sp. NBC_00582]WUB68492.1 hypothetical protein OG852_50220 [Streptomyces sp. NBC_00582]
MISGVWQTLGTDLRETLVQPYAERLTGRPGRCAQPFETAGDTERPGFLAQQLRAGSR